MKIIIYSVISIALIVLLLFGGKKIPELMSGLGKGVRSFKNGMDGKDEKPADKEEQVNETANKPE